MPKSSKYLVVGLMSGTSLDGLDIALCSFAKYKNKWAYHILHAETKKYAPVWKNKLKNAQALTAQEFVLLNNEYGSFIGKQVRQFISKHNVKPDFIASHGHTIFHQPEKHLTTQIGSGAAIAAETSLPVICDFRSLDVAYHGQGAPLVPIGDELLFGEYDICLNIGGFANLSYNNNNKRIAFDICPVNTALNFYAKKIGKDFDKNGSIARKGKIIPEMLSRLNSLKYYKTKPPKSLGTEWLNREFYKITELYIPEHQNILRTLCEHAAIQIASEINSVHGNKVLVTGGGSYNKFLIDLIREKTSKKIILPDDNIIQYKEALVFAFLGVLRWENLNNCLKSVTGAKFDNCGGAIYNGKTYKR